MTWPLHAPIRQRLRNRVIEYLEFAASPEEQRHCQATSDFSGLAQTLCSRTIGASYGDAFLAALGVGDATIGDIARWNPAAATIEPAPSEVTRRQYRIYRQIYQRNAGLMHEIGSGGGQ